MGRVAGAGFERSVTQPAFVAQSPGPSPSGIFRAPPPDVIQTGGALLAIVLALAAAVLGYRIIRGGRGL